MKTTTFNKLFLFLGLPLFLLSSCSRTKDYQLPPPKIKSGTAIISGKLIDPEKQKESILNYYNKETNKQIGIALFARNDKLEELDAYNQYFELKINETPAISFGESLLDAIISCYKGKVVLVDFWATWCIPCLGALNEFREMM